MSKASLADDFVETLRHNDRIRSRVGRRVYTIQTDSVLPEILVSETETRGDHAYPSSQVVLTCKAKTSVEARLIGAAVKNVFKEGNHQISGRRWVTVLDRSGYDSESKAFRRVIAIEPEL